MNRSIVKIQVIATVILISTLVIVSIDSAAKNCDSFGDVNYCTWKGSDETDTVLVYLHGVGRTATDWDEDKVTRGIANYWEKQKAIKPHIVALSYGRYWWYKEIDFGKGLNQALGAAESKLQVSPGKRFLLGDSMGGHNSLRWVSDFPENFDRLAVICPAIPKTMTKIKNGSKGIWPFNAGVERVFKGLYPEAEKNGEGGITEMFDFSSLMRMTRILIAATPTDHYGFYPGNLDLYYQLENRSFEGALSFVKEEVRHCLVGSEPVAQFFVEPHDADKTSTHPSTSN